MLSSAVWSLRPGYGNLTTYETYSDLEEVLRRYIDEFMAKMIKACEQVEKAHIDLLPTPFLSAVIDDCMARGIDVTAGGAKYNFSCVQMIQVANLADNLAAIKQLVYDEKIVSREELSDALQKNFEGYDILRARLLNKVPKYGNDVEWVDIAAAGTTRESYTVSAHVPMGE